MLHRTDLADGTRHDRTIDPYATLGLKPAATPQEIKRAYRKLARRYHPDVSKEPDAESRFKDVALAYDALVDPDKKAARDARSEPEPGPSAQEFAFNGFGADGGQNPGDFLEALYAQQARDQRVRDFGSAARSTRIDQHARVTIGLRDAYRGSLATVALHDRRLEVTLPKGVRHGQHLRLAGQAAPAFDGQPAGDLYLEIEIAPHADFRVEDRDVYTALPLAPWQAALGATLDLPTPDGMLEIVVPPGSAAGGRLRLKGQGIPATPPGDLYAVLSIVLPKADTDPARDAYRALARSFAGFDPRHPQETHR